MKILHAADLHFDALTHGRPDPSTGVNSRILDVERCWSAAVDAALEHDVDLAILAGDIFHSPHPSAEALARFAKHLRRLTCDVVLIAGNHERAAHPGRSCVLDIWADDPTVHVSTKPEVIEVAGLRIATLPSVSRHQLAANSDGLSRTELDQELMDRLEQILAILAQADPDVLTLHWPIQGSVLGNEADISIIPEPVIPLGALEGPWKYVAAGHIHKSQTIAANGQPWIGNYAGSIDRMNFGEEQEAKGVLIVTLDTTKSWGSIWVDLPATKFLTVNYGFDDDDEPDVEDAVIRWRFGVRPNQVEIDAVRKALEADGARSVTFDIPPAEKALPRAGTEDLAEGIGPMDGLELWMDLRDIPDSDRDGLRKRAEALLEGAS